MKSLSLTKPHLLVMVGLPGSGKSFFAEKFASTFGAPYVSEGAVRSLVEGDIDALIRQQLNELCKTQQSIVFDGAASTRSERSDLVAFAKKVGYELLFIWVQTDLVTAKSRASQMKTFDEGLYEKQVKRFVALSPTEKPLVLSGKHTYASQAKIVLKKLSSPRAELAAQPPRETSSRRNITIH